MKKQNSLVHSEPTDANLKKIYKLSRVDQQVTPLVESDVASLQIEELIESMEKDVKKKESQILSLN